TRITFQMKDIGIDSMDLLLNRVKYQIESVLYSEKIALEKIFSSKNKTEELDKYLNQNAWVLSAVEDSLVAQGKAEEFDFLMDEGLIKTFYNKPEFKTLISEVVSSS